MPELDLDRLRELRAREPDAIAAAAAARRRRPLLRGDGRLLLIAADHPARGVLGVGSRAMAMADRGELLRRLVTALERPGVDGVLGTPDVIDDLLLLGVLDDKVVIGSMNRGGLQGARFEIDDRFTGYDAATIATMGFEGGKMLCRIDLDDHATPATLAACAEAVSSLAARGLLAMVEPFLSRRVHGQLRNDLSADAVVRAVAIASGLGASSARTWLKLPVVDDMERVMAATTLPTLLLGGDPTTAPEQTYARWDKALALPGVRGLVVGRALLYPPDDDVAAAVDVAAALTHPEADDGGRLDAAHG
ncbi:MAG TPA: deoxyribose-phosphate aldolase [Egibacteraceae bacterium]